jgi:uncharacterized protein with von Willebrand factor type A (vWA) domain
MLHSKSNSRILEQAQRRVSVLNTFALDLNLGNGVSLTELQNLTESVRLMTDEYNNVAATFQQLGHQLREKEKALAEMGDRMVLVVAAKQGRKSREYLTVKAIRRVNRSKKRQNYQAAENGAANGTEPIEINTEVN